MEETTYDIIAKSLDRISMELVWNYTKLTKITIFLEYGFYQDN